MTTMNNSQTTCIQTAPRLENSYTIKNIIGRLKSAAARFWEDYQTGLANGHFFDPMS